MQGGEARWPRRRCPPSFASHSTAYREIFPGQASEAGWTPPRPVTPNDVQNDIGKSRVADGGDGPANFAVSNRFQCRPSAPHWPICTTAPRGNPDGLADSKNPDAARAPSVRQSSAIDRSLAALLMPFWLQQALGQMGAIAFAQKKARFILRAPLGIKTWKETGHVQWFSGGPPAKSRCDFALPFMSYLC